VNETLIAVACGVRTLLLTKAEVAAGVARAAGMGLGEPAQSAASTVAPEPLLNSRELARLTGVGDTLLEAMARDNRIPSIRIGKALRFKFSAVEAALAAQKQLRRS
jgi:excisionase family DNA binding protein